MNFGYKKLYINGSLQDSEEGSKHDVICPATGEKIAPAVIIKTGIDEPTAATTTKPNIIVGIANKILKNWVNIWSILEPAIEDPIPKVTPIT